MLEELWHNVTHNLFKPLLLFFYFGFLIPVLKVRFDFPHVIYQGLTAYLLLAIGWHGGEELAAVNPSTIGRIAGFMVAGFAVNFLIGIVAYFLLNYLTTMRRIDRATVAGYYGSDSAGTFATCVGVLTSVGIAVDAYMPVMLAIMEIPGCLVALYLVARLRARGMDAAGNTPGELGYTVPNSLSVGACVAARPAVGHTVRIPGQNEADPRHQESPERPELVAAPLSADDPIRQATKATFAEVLLNPGLCLLIGAVSVGFISGLQGQQVVHDDDVFFVSAFQGALCLFLLEMGMTASRTLKDLKSAGFGLVFFGLLAPNVFASLGILLARTYNHLTHTDFKPGTYVLFAVLCAAASYIAVPAVQRLAIPEASPSLPLAASLGLTFSYNVTIGIPLYIEIARILGQYIP